MWPRIVAPRGVDEARAQNAVLARRAESNHERSDPRFFSLRYFSLAF
jgi:hypothetical protein